MHTQQPNRHPFPLPPSPYYQLTTTPTSGRSIVATTTIPRGTILLNTSSTPRTLSPLAWVVRRAYRKETCAQCWAYDRGREWKLRVPDRDCGVVFCSETCRGEWMDFNGDVGVMAWEKLEGAVKGMVRRVGGGGGEEERNGETRVEVGQEEVDDEWEKVSLVAEVISRARLRSGGMGRNERRVIANVIRQGGEPDLMFFMLTAVIAAYRVAEEWRAAESTQTPSNGDGQHTDDTSTRSDNPTSTHTDTDLSTSTLLSPLFALEPSLTAYTHRHDTLHALTTSHLFLLTHLPIPLLHYLTPVLTHALFTRTTHNGFSIRPSAIHDGSDSGEFLGEAVFPSASFFNHSCDSNVDKERRGREWSFVAKREVKAGDELVITYLGGEEWELGVQERRERLVEGWGFVCGCRRCRKESEEGVEVL